MNFKPSRKATLISATCLGLAGAAFAFIPDFYARLGIPDYDQRWDDLPGNGDMFR